MKEKQRYSTKKVFKRLFKEHIRPYKMKLASAGFFMFIVALCAAGIVRIVEPAIDRVFLHHDKKMLVILPIVMLGLSVLRGSAEYFQNYLIKSVGQRILSDLQIKLYAHLLRSDIEFIDLQSSARLISRFTNDISLMRGAVSNLFVGVAKHFLTVLFLIGIMFSLEPMLSFIIFFIFPLAIYPIQKNGRKIRKLAYEAQEQLGNYTAKLDETFSAIKIVKSYRAERFEEERAKNFIEHIYNLYKSTAKYDALTSPIMESLSGLAIAFIIIYGGYMVEAGKTTPGALFAFITAFVSAYRPYKSLVSFNVNLQEGVAAATRLFKVLDKKPEIEEYASGKTVDFSKSDIKFNNVVLKYGEKTALNNLNLEIKKGKSIAIVGKSGEGKTSILNLLLRFYDATDGELLIGGENIKNIKLSNLRSQIALVTQDTLLFDATIAENIAYNISGCKLDDIIESAKKAHAHEFIEGLPNGYDTVIGPQGKSLSGGQRQRIALARAFLKDAPILILDEATSSLDPETESGIKSAMQEVSKGRTTITITHRLHTIENSDSIYVIKGGRVLEQGTHEELLRLRGEYYLLYNSQKDI